ncbi:MAG: selenium-dependent molybdenum cofactor biosynthesis protein YqeB [Desulfobacterales bacterium]|nr:selenium-dependent molybdenum cofactor biosynthesis protein YqeB [Desulfobacterales bacterium]
MSALRPSQLVVGIKGAGEMASAVAWRLHQANIRQIFMMEIARPLAVRRKVSYCEAIFSHQMAIEGVPAVKTDDARQIRTAWKQGRMAVIIDPGWAIVRELQPQVLLDGILAKTNLGTRMDEAPLVIGLGPGFCAGDDVHMVIETNRGHNLGRIITSGISEANTGVPGSIGGYTTERVLRAPADGIFHSEREIGNSIRSGEVVGTVGQEKVKAQISGVIRGLIRSGNTVPKGIKLGDIDPRPDAVSYCDTISDKARAIGGSVLEAVLRVYNG